MIFDWLIDFYVYILLYIYIYFQKYDEIINRFFWYFGDFCWKVGELDIFFLQRNQDIDDDYVTRCKCNMGWAVAT